MRNSTAVASLHTVLQQHKIYIYTVLIAALQGIKIIPEMLQMLVIQTYIQIRNNHSLAMKTVTGWFYVSFNAI